jgi:hypothetical protein
MAIFANSAATQTTTVTNSATQVFNTSASGIPTGVTLRELTIMNNGTNTVYLGSSNSVTASTGLALGPYQQITYVDWAYAQGASGGNVYGITSSGTSVVVAGLATVNANV